MTLKVEGNK